VSGRERCVGGHQGGRNCYLSLRQSLAHGERALDPPSPPSHSRLQLSKNGIAPATAHLGAGRRQSSESARPTDTREQSFSSS
jgi:hypothetical protein